MNYVGSISIIDRGDAPAKAVIDKNVRSLAQRVADETKEELDKVMDRVDNIYVSYEMATQTMFDNPRGSPNVEYIEDIKELEDILTDTVRKKKYQQQVTVFVVGFQNVCAQKMQLLQQVNQFFLENSKMEEDEIVDDKPEVDLDEAAKQVNSSLSTAGDLAKKLADINQDMVEWLVNYANTKASNKGKKRLEKNLEAAKIDITDLSEKLLKLQTELEEKDEKFQLMAKQLDAKTQEAVRFKTAAEVAKKSAQDNEAHTSMLHDEIKMRDEKIQELRSKLSRLEINLSETQFDKELVSKRMDKSQAQTQKLFEISEENDDSEQETAVDYNRKIERLAKLQEEVETKKATLSEAERELQKLHNNQLVALQSSHKQEIDELQQQHQEEVAKLTETVKMEPVLQRMAQKEELAQLKESLEKAETFAAEFQDESYKLKAQVIELQLREPTKENFDEITRISDDITERLSSAGKSIGELSNQEEEQVRQESSKSSKKSESLKASKQPSRSLNRPFQKGGKKEAEVTIQDEGESTQKLDNKTNDGNRQPSRVSKNLDAVAEGDGTEFTNAFELDDEESWSSVPQAHIPGRFLQYRQLSVSKLRDLEDQLQVTLTKTHRKVNSLKSQFNEHKNKWESERKILIEQVEQAQKLQTDAEKEADAAMTQLEEFINEQEKLEDEEEAKRQEIIKTMSRPGTTRRKASAKREKKPPTPDEKPEAQKPDEYNDNSEELKDLMQQTDDAKAQEKSARQTGAASAPPAVEPEDRAQKSVEKEPITGNTEEEVRISSAKSRASLRSQFKSRLDETRHAVETRKTHSPVITVPAQKSVDDELIIESDDEDDLPIPDDLKEEALMREDTLDAASPPPGKRVSRQVSLASRKSTNLSEHPLVQEYMRVYAGIHNFKEAMSRVLMDKDQMSASQLITELEALTFNKDDKVVPQISKMSDNVYYVLSEVSQIINNVIQNDRGPVVSSLMMGMTRDNTQRSMMREKSGITDGMQTTRHSQRSEKIKSASTDRHYQDLQEQYEKFNFDVKITKKGQTQMSEDAKRYEEQQQRNVVAMMEMQDTINHLQRELSALGKQGNRPMSESVSTAAQQLPESAIMFTRLDSERNAKIMKRAVNEEKLDPNKYKEAVVQMDEYVSLPAQRLSHLVRKYVHHVRMKEIESNVQKSQSLNENVFEVFDKMEALQNQRAKRWADKMDEMGMDRYRLANMLMETLDSIEQDCGIFLIKPMYSYRGREPKERFGGKISRPFRPHRTLSPLRDSHSAYAPAPTPASNVRPPRVQRRDDSQYTHAEEVGKTGGQYRSYEPTPPLDGSSAGLMGSSVHMIGNQPQATWSMSDSQTGGGGFMMGNVNTPRILELDINRMMIGQNTISAQVGSQGLSNDRLVNATNTNLRSYMTVNRPGQSSVAKSDRPRSGSRTSPILSTSPTSLSGSRRVRMSAEGDLPVMSSAPPLPPIGRQQSHDGKKSTSGTSRGRTSPHIVPIGNEVPDSPPGSSLRQSPPGAEE
ncbi:myosin-11-like isoform X3 [Mya arenaria]|uniref:myosin-11-like isoform X3 n=1 Tax=Mya arenaria TaxID=6604 RepID=UPI0022DF89B8|nr:myosin-11-like isoform X3 [Mya arenaria]